MMIKIDGSFGEGGGQILRTAISLATILKKPCQIFNIRKKRPNPGLANQHLIYLESQASLCQGRLEGNFLGSKEIKFFPEENWQENLKLKIGTAASITLILQGILLSSIFSSKKIKIKFEGGATDTFFSPGLDYFRFVFLKFLEKFLLEKIFKKKIEILKLKIERRGFYPKGGARLEAEILPIPFFSKKEKLIFPKEKGGLKKILIISGASADLEKRKVSQRQISGLKQTALFYKKLKLPIETKIEYYSTISSGSQITIVGEFENTIFGTNHLGKIGKSAEEVGREAGIDFLKESQKPGLIDRYLADQILPYLALFTKESQISVTKVSNHAKTNIWVIEKFLEGKFKIEKNLIKWKEKIK